MWFPFVDHQPTFWWKIPTYAADSPSKNDGFCLLPPRFIPWGAMLDLGSVFLGGHPWEHLHQLHCLGIDAALKVCRYVPLWLVVTSQVPFLFSMQIFYGIAWFLGDSKYIICPCFFLVPSFLSRIFGHPNHDLPPNLLAHLPLRNTSHPRVNPIDPPLGYCVNPFPVISCVYIYIYIYVCTYM